MAPTLMFGSGSASASVSKRGCSDRVFIHSFSTSPVSTREDSVPGPGREGGGCF